MLSKKALSRVQAAIVIVVAVVAVAAGAYYYSTTLVPVPTRSDIIIGASISITGAVAPFGEEAQFGYTYAINATNARGGLFIKEAGRRVPIRFVWVDGKSDPTVAAANVEKLINVDKVDALLGEVSSPLTAGVTPVAERYKVPYEGGISSQVSIHERGFKYMFISFHKAPDEVLIYFLWMNALSGDQRPKTIAIWEEATDLGAENAKFVKQFADQYGYKIVLSEKYTPGADFTAVVTKTKAANPDAVCGIPSPPDAISMFKVAKELKFSPKLFCFTRGTASGRFGPSLGKDAESATATFAWHPDLPFSVNKDLVDAWLRAKGGRAPTLVGIFHAGAQIMIDAIERAGTVDKEAIREAIAKTDLDTTMGRIQYTADGRVKDSINLMLIEQWQGGKLVIVYASNPQVKTAKFIYPFIPWESR